MVRWPKKKIAKGQEERRTIPNAEQRLFKNRLRQQENPKEGQARAKENDL